MADNKRGDRTRRRIYGGVLLFTAAVVILLTAVPALRARLFDRVYILKTALTGEAQPDIVPMGENDIPYPEEFLRPASGAIAPEQYFEPIQKRLTAAGSNVQSTPPAFSAPADSKIPAGAEYDEEPDLTPRFQQGEAERDAYEKTLASNEKLAGMVQGDDSELRFKTWGAARRDGGVYWVRVIFQNAAGADVEYIWQTDVPSGKTAPLNFNARSL